MSDYEKHAEATLTGEYSTTHTHPMPHEVLNREIEELEYKLQQKRLELAEYGGALEPAKPDLRVVV